MIVTTSTRTCAHTSVTLLARRSRMSNAVELHRRRRRLLVCRELSLGHSVALEINLAEAESVPCQFPNLGAAASNGAHARLTHEPGRAIRPTPG